MPFPFPQCGPLEQLTARLPRVLLFSEHTQRQKISRQGNSHKTTFKDKQPSRAATYRNRKQTVPQQTPSSPTNTPAGSLHISQARTSHLSQQRLEPKDQAPQLRVLGLVTIHSALTALGAIAEVLPMPPGSTGSPALSSYSGQLSAAAHGSSGLDARALVWSCRSGVSGEGHPGAV